MSETTAEPLPRLGCYRVEEKPGTNPAGPVVSGAALAAYWCELVEYCVGKRERRAAAAIAIDAARASGDAAETASIMRWRYGQKIEIKSAEAVAELLHGIIAPGAPFLCDERCPHVARDASADQVKRFLDSLDAEIDELRVRWRTCPYDHPCHEDLQDEFGVYERWRRRLAGVAVR